MKIKELLFLKVYPSTSMVEIFSGGLSYTWSFGQSSAFWTIDWSVGAFHKLKGLFVNRKLFYPSCSQVFKQLIFHS